MKNMIFISFLFFAFGCSSDKANPSLDKKAEAKQVAPKTYETTGNIERLDPRLEQLISKDAKLEIIAEGFDWTEGPLWVAKHEMLLFSDIPPNKIFQWTEANGLKEYLHPSGYTGEIPRKGEPGSNGLLLNDQGQLVLCQHGDRRMAIMDAPVDQPSSKFTTIASHWKEKQFNSPNDAIYDKAGNLFFTDPPYGLLGQMDDPTKEIPFQGIFKALKDGSVSLQSDELSRPNGIAFSPDQKTVYVANSDPKRAIWMAYDMDEQRNFSNGRVFFDAMIMVGKEKGLPDGLKVDDQGNLWATGPGGVLVFSPQGEHLGTIKTGQATSNCAFNEDKTVLYITADGYLLRLKLN